MTVSPRRVDPDDKSQWAELTVNEYIDAAVHRMLNQMNSIQFVMDAVSEPEVITAITEARSPLLEDLDLTELLGDAAKSCSSLVRTMKQLHRFAEFKREQSDGTPPESLFPDTP
jgi:hypothetical protein